MATTKNSSKNGVEPIAEEYRTRFMYCSIGATLLCLGVIILVSGLVVYIISATGHSYVNSMLIHHQLDYNNSYWPIIIAIILSSAGIAFITIAIVFTLLACFSHGRIEEQFKKQQQQQQQQTVPSSPVSTTVARNTVYRSTSPKVQHTSEEAERLISSPTPHPPPHVHEPLNRTESMMSPSKSNNVQYLHSPQYHHHQQQPPPPPPPPLPSQVVPGASTPQQYTHYVPIISSKAPDLQQTPVMENHRHQQQQISSPTFVATHHHSNVQNADMNTVGLPLGQSHNHPKKVPPNGFSYLTHPEEIQIYHEYHHQRTHSNGGNRTTPAPPPTRHTVRSHCSRESFD